MTSATQYGGFLGNLITWLDLNSHYQLFIHYAACLWGVYECLYAACRYCCSGKYAQSFPPIQTFTYPITGLEYTFEESLYDSGDDDLSLGIISSHTHKYGTDYNVYRKRKADNKRRADLW